MGRKGGALQHPLEDFKKRRKWCGQRPDLQQSTPGVQEEMLAQGEKGTGPGSDTNANHKLRPTKQQVRAGVRTSLGVQPTSGTPWGIAAEPARGALAHSRRRSGWRSPRTSVKRRPKSRAHAHEVGAGVLLARSEQGAEPGRTQSRVRAHGKCTRARSGHAGRRGAASAGSGPVVVPLPLPRRFQVRQEGGLRPTLPPGSGTPPPFQALPRALGLSHSGQMR